MDATTKDRMKRKFDTHYVLAKEGMSFLKYPAVFDLERRHEVDLRIAYQKDVSA